MIAREGGGFAIEGRVQRFYGGSWIVASMRYADSAGEARSIARKLAGDLEHQYRAGSRAEISHGSLMGKR